MARLNSIWWGPPKKFSTNQEERKISWLELFYDLVYVIAISKTTYYLAHHTTVQGILDYIYLFVMIFWGWFNGSMYYDLHGSPGIRTRLMTLWQMMAVAALAVTLSSPPDKLVHNTTIGIIMLQGYITYLWWSVGIYDKDHRRLNGPYIILYLLALAILFTTFFVPQPYKRMLFLVTLLLNYLPPFLLPMRTGGQVNRFNLSSSMVERLGLLTIIVFGEAILGVINGMCLFNETNMAEWLCFGMGILIVFALWWIFFGIVADREAGGGFLHGQLMSFIYIPTLASLGMVGAGFPALMATLQQGADKTVSLLEITYGISIAIFLCCIAFLCNFLQYPPHYQNTKRRVQSTLFISAATITIVTLTFRNITLIQYLAIIFLALAIITAVIVRIWYVAERTTATDNTAGALETANN